MRLSEFQTVRIKTLVREDTAYDPFGDNERAPLVGDTGTIVDVRAQPGGQLEYTVECCRQDGTCAWIADFVQEELEATEAEACGTETESERLRSRPVCHHHSGAPADESVRSFWRLYAAVVAAVLFFAFMVAAMSLLFIVWPPGSAAGAGFRAAAVGVVFVAAGCRLFAGEGILESLITATIVGVIFLIVGATGWYAWTAV